MEHRQRVVQAVQARDRANGDREDSRAGHSLTIDSGWQEVAETALKFLDGQGLRP